MIHEPLKVPRFRPTEPVGMDGDRRHGAAGDISPVDRQARPTFPDRLTLAIVAEVLAERMRQVEAFGHTPDADMALPLSALPIAASFKLDRATRALVKDLAHAQDRARAAADHAQFNNRAPARANLIKAAAMILAAVARIDGDAEGIAP